MKNMIYFVLAVFLLANISAVHALTVSVADVTLPADKAIEPSNPRIESGKNEFNDAEEIRYAIFTLPVTIANGSETIKNISVNLGQFSYQPFTEEVASIALQTVDKSFPETVANSTQNYVVKFIMPSNLDSVDRITLQPKKYEVIVNVETLNSGTIQAKLGFYINNPLELDDVELRVPEDSFTCDVEQNTEALDCDDEVEELDRNEDFTLEFVAKNNLDSDEDNELDMDLTIKSDKDIDADDDKHSDKISADDEQAYSITFDVDEDIEDGDSFEIIIEADAIDENGAFHGFRHNLDIEFSVPEYQVQLMDLQLSPASICAGESTTATFGVENTGSNKQSSVRIVLENAVLGLNKIYDKISLAEEDESDNDYRGTHVIETKSTLKAGTYPISFTTYYKDEDSSNAFEKKSASLTIVDCDAVGTNDDSTVIPPASQTNQTIVIAPPIVVTNATNNAQPTTPVVTAISTPTSSIDMVTVLYGGAFVVLLIVLIVIIAALFGKKQSE